MTPGPRDDPRQKDMGAKAMLQIFFDGWQSIGRTLAIGPLAYLVLVLTLRVSGKRTLSKMNAFDLVVTVALGSTLATVLLSKDVALADGAAALGLLVALQFAVTWSSVRWGWIRRMVRSEPSLLLRRGELMPGALRQQRVIAEEVLSAIRSAGVAAVEDVEAVVLETDGTFSVVERSGSGKASSLETAPAA
jgi:uncharacterized membrane protein YcaP (DUF421 family)